MRTPRTTCGVSSTRNPTLELLPSATLDITTQLLRAKRSSLELDAKFSARGLGRRPYIHNHVHKSQEACISGPWAPAVRLGLPEESEVTSKPRPKVVIHSIIHHCYVHSEMTFMAFQASKGTKKSSHLLTGSAVNPQYKICDLNLPPSALITQTKSRDDDEENQPPKPR